jgi:hypothetical protein
MGGSEKDDMGGQGNTDGHRLCAAVQALAAMSHGLVGHAAKRGAAGKTPLPSFEIPITIGARATKQSEVGRAER